MANVAVSLKIQRHPFPSNLIRSPAGPSEPRLGERLILRAEQRGRRDKSEYKNAPDMAAQSALRDQTKGRSRTPGRKPTQHE